MTSIGRTGDDGSHQQAAVADCQEATWQIAPPDRISSGGEFMRGKTIPIAGLAF